MQFNFDETFSHYTNSDLLKIVNQPDAYQSEAVAAANRILKNRVINQTELNTVLEEIEISKTNEKNTIDRFGQIAEKIANPFIPVSKETNEMVPQKWVNLLLLLLGLQIFWKIFSVVTLKLKVLSCSYCYPSTYSEITDALLIAYMVLTFVLLYKRKRWGWILIFADTLIGVLNWFYMLFSYVVSEYDLIRPAAPNMFSLIVMAGLLFVMWKSVITDIFNVTTQIKSRTAIIAIIIFFLVYLLTPTLYALEYY